MNLLEGKSLYHSVQICQLSKMVRLIGMKADPLRHQNNETIFIPIGAGLMWDYNTDDLDLTLISFMVLCTILLAVLLKVCVRDDFFNFCTTFFSGELHEVADTLRP